MAKPGEKGLTFGSHVIPKESYTIVSIEDCMTSPLDARATRQFILFIGHGLCKIGGKLRNVWSGLTYCSNMDDVDRISEEEDSSHSSNHDEHNKTPNKCNRKSSSSICLMMINNSVFKLTTIKNRNRTITIINKSNSNNEK